jgi:sporulation protein YlmC with PRC-barrel domain
VVNQGGLSAETILDDMTVYGPTGEDIGDVENIVVGADGRALSLIVEVYGFADIGDTHLSVPWDELTFNEEGDGVTIPVTEGQALDYSNLTANPLITAEEAFTEIQQVEGEGPGRGETGAGAWRATDLIHDYARLKEGDGFIAYGYVEDVILKRNGEVASVIVNARGGYYAYPYYGYAYGWRPAAIYYDLPYTREEVTVMQPMDPEDAHGDAALRGGVGPQTIRPARAMAFMNRVPRRNRRRRGRVGGRGVDPGRRAAGER